MRLLLQLSTHNQSIPVVQPILQRLVLVFTALWKTASSDMTNNSFAFSWDVDEEGEFRQILAVMVEVYVQTHRKYL